MPNKERLQEHPSEVKRAVRWCLYAATCKFVSSDIKEFDEHMVAIHGIKQAPPKARKARQEQPAMFDRDQYQGKQSGTIWGFQ